MGDSTTVTVSTYTQYIIIFGAGRAVGETGFNSQVICTVPYQRCAERQPVPPKLRVIVAVVVYGRYSGVARAEVINRRSINFQFKIVERLT